MLWLLWSLVPSVSMLLKLEIQGGYFIFVLMDWYSGSWSLIFLAVLEVILVAWVSYTMWKIVQFRQKGSFYANIKFYLVVNLLKSQEKYSSLHAWKSCTWKCRCMGSSAYVGTYITWEFKPPGTWCKVMQSGTLIWPWPEICSRIAAAYWEVTWRFACPFLLFSVMVASLVNPENGIRSCSYEINRWTTPQPVKGNTSSQFGQMPLAGVSHSHLYWQFCLHLLLR